MAALLKRTEYETLAVIPNLIHEAGQGVRDAARALSLKEGLSQAERLALLMESVK